MATKKKRKSSGTTARAHPSGSKPKKKSRTSKRKPPATKKKEAPKEKPKKPPPKGEIGYEIEDWGDDEEKKDRKREGKKGDYPGQGRPGGRKVTPAAIRKRRQRAREANAGSGDETIDDSPNELTSFML